MHTGNYVPLLFVQYPTERFADLPGVLMEWGYRAELCGVRSALTQLSGYRVVLCSLALARSEADQVFVDKLMERCQQLAISFLFYSLGSETATDAFFPTVPLNNRALLRDYLRLKVLENEDFDTSDSFAKALLKKDIERENAQRQAERLLHYLPQWVQRMPQKSLMLSRRGTVLAASQGYLAWTQRSTTPQRHELLQGLHPDDIAKLQETFRNFATRQVHTDQYWVRHKAGAELYHHFKLQLSNHLDSPGNGFVVLHIESIEAPEAPTSIPGLRNWLPDLLEGIGEAAPDQASPFRFNTALLMPLFLHFGQLTRILWLRLDPSGTQLGTVQEWCNTPERFSSSFPNHELHPQVGKDLVQMLEHVCFTEINFASADPRLQQLDDLQRFAERYHLLSFVPVPIESNAKVFGYLLIDTHQHTQLHSTYPFFGQSPDAETTTESSSDMRSAFDFLNFLPIPISIKDQQHRWVTANDAMLDFLGKRREQVIGQTDYDLFSEDEANVFWETDELVLQEHINFQNEEYIRTADGQLRIVVTNKSPFRAPGGDKIVISTMKDVTRLKEIEKDLRERTEKLRKSERNLKNLNSTKDRFFSIIAHDLKNPFNTLVGFTSVLAEDIDQFERAEIEEFIKILSEAAQNGYKLLENLLDWARTQTGRFQFEPGALNLPVMIESCIQLLGPQAERKNINLHAILDKPHFAYGDANMVELVLRNLVSNAVKFTNFGGEVRIELADQGNTIECSVIDNGVGISDDDLAKLFRIDVEFSSPGTDAETGTGLGLILCKEFVEKNGGSIGAESRVGLGSRFFFSLPKTIQYLPPV